MSVQNGDVVILQIGGVQLGALLKNDLNNFADMIDKSNKDLPGVKQYTNGETGWSISVESLYDPAATEGFSEALGYLKAGTELTVKHGDPDGETFSGSGFISSIDVSGPKNEIGSYTLEIQGTGVVGEYGAELHTLSNAAADPNGTEADATTGFTSFGLDGTGANVFESQAGIVDTGSYALHMDSNDTPTSAARIYLDLQAAPFSFTDGQKGKITFAFRHVGTGDSWGVYLGATNSGVQNIIESIGGGETTWANKEYTWTHDSDHRYLVIRESSAGNTGGCYIDNISIKKKL